MAIIIHISELSFKDFVGIVAKFNSIHSGKKAPTQTELEKRGYNKKALEMIKTQSKTNEFESMGLKFTRPLESFKYDLFEYILTLYNGYEKGVMPFKGSLTEQPAQIIEIFSIISALKSEAELRALKSQAASNSVRHNQDKHRTSRQGRTKGPR